MLFTPDENGASSAEPPWSPVDKNFSRGCCSPLEFRSDSPGSLILDFARKISTMWLDLIPRDERSPACAECAAWPATNRRACVARPCGWRRRRPAKRIRPGAAARARPRRHGRRIAPIARVCRGSAARRSRRPRCLGEQVFKQRFDLLLPGWLAERMGRTMRRLRVCRARVAGRSVPRRNWRPSRPTGGAGFSGDQPADPLLLIPGLVERVPEYRPDVGTAGGADRGLIWARTRASPFSRRGPGPGFAAVAPGAGGRADRGAGGGAAMDVDRRFRRREPASHRDGNVGLNCCRSWRCWAWPRSACGACTRRCIFRPRFLCSLLGAWVATTWLFDRVHVLVFRGGFTARRRGGGLRFYLILQPPSAPGNLTEKVGRLLKPLLASAAHDRPGVFDAVVLRAAAGPATGCVCERRAAVRAGGGVALVSPESTSRFLETAPLARAASPVGRPAVRRGALALLLLGALVALVGPWRLHWRDDIRGARNPGTRTASQRPRTPHPVRRHAGPDGILDPR